MKPKLAGLVGAALLLSSCASTSSYDLAMAQCRSDADPRWLERPRKIDQLFMLGEVRDPARTGGQLVSLGPTYSDLDGNVEQVRRHLGASWVLVYARGSAKSAVRFGPGEEELDGVYRLEAFQRGDRRCRKHDAVEAARQAEAAQSGSAYVRYVPERLCLGYKRLGDLAAPGSGYVMYFYNDLAFRALGQSRTVHEIRDAQGAVVARSVQYLIHGGPLGTCVQGRPAPELSDLFGKTGDQ